MDKKLHTLPDLPYAYDALEPYISKEIMELHHGKHHAAYVKNLNDVIEPYENLQGKTAEELLMNLDQLPEAIRAAVKNNAGGHVNHSMFWQIMKPSGGGELSGVLEEEINKYFGNFEEFKIKFNDVGAKRFGSGWVWLVRTKDGKLDVQYSLQAVERGGNTTLCNALDLKIVRRDLTEVYSGKMMSLSLQDNLQDGDVEEWIVFLSLSDSSETLKQKQCDFDLYFRTYRNTPGEGLNGIHATRTLTSTITSGTW